MPNKFESSEAIKFGWGKMKENTWFFVQVMLVIFSVQIIIGSIQETDFVKANSVIEIAMSIFSWVIAAIIEMGAIRIALDVVRDKKPRFEDLWSQNDKLVDFLLTNILYSLKVIAGLILLIVPGLIWAVKHMFYSYMVVDGGEKPFEAMRKSGEITDGEKWNLVVFGFYCLGLNILGLLCLVVGLFFTIPATMIATAYVFEKLAGPAVIAAAKETEAQLPPVAPAV